MRPSCGLLGFSIVAALLTITRPAAAQNYTVTDLGDLGGAQAIAYDINAVGQVVGQSRTESGHLLGFIWLPHYAYGLPPGMYSLGTLGGSYGEASGINASGQVVGRAFLSGDTAYHAVLWPQTGAAIDLGTLGGRNSQAFDINDSGEVVGWSDTSANTRHAFSWRDRNGNGASDPGEMIDLGHLGGGQSIAYGINAIGEIVGTSSKVDFASHAFRTTPTGTIGPISDLETLGGFSSTAYRINNASRVVGHSLIAGNSESHAFRTAPGSRINPDTDGLGTLGGTRSEAWGINAFGQAVGWSYFDASSSRKAFFSAGSGMVDLNTRIDPGLGWRLDAAFAINDAGEIVGSGSGPDGGSRAFLLRPRVNVRLTLESPVVTGCLSLTGIVTLEEPAADGGAVVILRKSAELTAVHLPPFVIVPAGFNTASFTITTTGVFERQTGSITADFFGAGESVILTLRPISVAALILKKDQVNGPQPARATLLLECPVPAEIGFITVKLDSSDIFVVRPELFAVTLNTGEVSMKIVFETEKVDTPHFIAVKAAANGRETFEILTVK